MTGTASSPPKGDVFVFLFLLTKRQMNTKSTNSSMPPSGTNQKNQLQMQQGKKSKQ